MIPTGLTITMKKTFTRILTEDAISKLENSRQSENTGPVDIFGLTDDLLTALVFELSNVPQPKLDPFTKVALVKTRKVIDNLVPKETQKSTIGFN